MTWELSSYIGYREIWLFGASILSEIHRILYFGYHLGRYTWFRGSPLLMSAVSETTNNKWTYTWQRYWATTWQNQQNEGAPAKPHISLGIRPVWSESSLCAQWVAKDQRFLHAYSEDSDQTGRMPRLIWVFAGRALTLLVLSCRGSYCSTSGRGVCMVSQYFCPETKLQMSRRTTKPAK